VNSLAQRFGQPSTVAVALLTVALLGGCGSDASKGDSAAGASTSSSQSAERTTAFPKPTTVAPTSTAVTTAEQRAQFDVTMVRSVEVNKVNKGGQANVQVVAGMTDPDALLDVAKGCVKHYLKEQKAAFCHVWGTEANYAARDPQGVGDLLCWTHYVGVPLVGGDPIVTTSKPYMLQVDGCPDAAA
jgi:hypothetical protein